MNKSLLTNCLAVVVFLIGYQQGQSIVLMTGLFALSGAVTNWLAVHMLFEKVPGLYGSGVIPARFEDFKLGIRALMMEQFFTSENIDRFLTDIGDDSGHLDLEPVIENTDLSPAFDALLHAIQGSSFAGMLAMVGGTAALTPLKEPFIERMRSSLLDITKTDSFQTALHDGLKQSNQDKHMQHKIGEIIEKRLDELTPGLVKEIIQKMIREHLGWLVVWGGVFGGLIGLATGYLAGTTT